MTTRIHFDTHGVAINDDATGGIGIAIDQIGEIAFTDGDTTLRFGDVARFVRELVAVERFASEPDVDVEPGWPTIRVTTWTGPTHKGDTTDYPMDTGSYYSDPRRFGENAGALVFSSGGQSHAIPWHRIERVEFIGWSRDDRHGF